MENLAANKKHCLKYSVNTKRLNLISEYQNLLMLSNPEKNLSLVCDISLFRYGIIIYNGKELQYSLVIEEKLGIVWHSSFDEK